MNPHRAGISAISVLFLLATLTPLAPVYAQQQQQPQPRRAQVQVPLGYGVPKDVHFYVHGLTSENPDPGYLLFEKAMSRLVDSGIHEDIMDLAMINLSPKKRAETKSIVDHVLGLLGLVDWSLLGEREVVFSYRLAIPMPEYLMIFRVPDDRIGKQVTGMKTLFVEIARMVGLPESSVRDIERRSGTITVFQAERVPMQLVAGAVGDVLVLSTSSRMASSAMKRLTSGNGKGSLVTSETFQASVQQLPKATEDTLFVNLGGLMDYARQAMQLAKAGVHSDTGARDAADAVDFIAALFEELDIFDHVMNTTSSDGTTVTQTARLQMKPDFESSMLARTFKEQQPWEDWSRLVPADATEFYLDTGMNPVALCDLVIALLKENVHNPEKPTAILTHIRDDLLANISGEIACISLPKAGPAGCELGECVAFLRLEESEGVAERAKAHLEGLAPYLASRGQKMEITTSGSVHEIRLAAFPWIRPAFALRDNCLVIASSSAAIERVDRVRKGKEPNIRSRQEFARLGIGEAKAAAYLAYGQATSSASGLANLMSAGGFVLSLLPEERDTRALIKIGAILTKLAPVLRDMEMSYDWGIELLPSNTPDAFMTRTVYRYR